MISPVYVVPRLGDDVPVAGHTVSVVAVPQDIVDFLNIVPGALVIGGPVPAWLDQASRFMAEFNGGQLHHAEWRITDSSGDLEEWIEDPKTLADAIAGLDDHPALAVGKVYLA